MLQNQTGEALSASKGEIPQCHIHDKTSVAEAIDIRNNVCTNDLALIAHTDGKYYCLFHLPTKNKDVATFERVFRDRLNLIDIGVANTRALSREERQDPQQKLFYDFRYVWFPSEVIAVDKTFKVKTDFGRATFLIGANFKSATFSADVSFSHAIFLDEVSFQRTLFSSNASFRSTVFSKITLFHLTTFSGSADFTGSEFSEISLTFFANTKFVAQAKFKYAQFAGHVIFQGDADKKVFINPEGIDLQYTRLERPERIYFNSIYLCPSWFVNADSRKIIFTDVTWNNLDPKIRYKNIKDELKKLEKLKISRPNRLLEIVSRQLAVNADENNRYEEASKFRLMANDTKRLEKFRGFTPWTLHWWYWLSSSYGESWRRALTVLAGVLLTFAIGYTQATFYVCPPDIPLSQSSSAGSCETRRLDFSEGLRHSLATALFQNVEYRKPVTQRSELFVLLEKIFGPLQAALLALAIRRKFMR